MAYQGIQPPRLHARYVTKRYHSESSLYLVCLRFHIRYAFACSHLFTNSRWLNQPTLFCGRPCIKYALNYPLSIENVYPRGDFFQVFLVTTENGDLRLVDTQMHPIIVVREDRLFPQINLK